MTLASLARPKSFSHPSLTLPYRRELGAIWGRGHAHQLLFRAELRRPLLDCTRPSLLGWRYATQLHLGYLERKIG